MKIGILGVGHMGSAMVKGWVHSAQILPEHIFVQGGSGNTAKNLQHDIPFTLVKQTQEFEQCDVIFLAVKTPIIISVLQELKPLLSHQQIPVISVSAGVTVDEMLTIVGKDYPIAQAIPNTPVEINQGTTGVVFSPNVSNEQKEIMMTSLELLGNVFPITPDLIDIFGTLAGCGPAFVDIFIESLADGAVMHGMSREMAYEVAASMVKSAAELLLVSGKHPGELKDAVTSPGGTTIKGVTALEKEGFRYATIHGIDAIMKK